MTDQIPEMPVHTTTAAHPELVKVLVKSGQDIINGLTPSTMNLLHMAVGIIGEVSELAEATLNELTVADLIEETGDALFYLEGIKQELGFDWTQGCLTEAQTQMGMSGRSLLLIMTVAAGNLIDAVKRLAIYGQPVSDEAVARIFSEGYFLLWLLDEYAERRGFTLDAARDANIQKLSKRYPKLTYTDQAAKDRADKQLEPETRSADTCDQSASTYVAPAADTSSCASSDSDTSSCDAGV